MAALNSVLNSHPDHPGANHLFIHLVENSQHPELALPHAERLGNAMPEADHIVHMPSHIYIRTGRYAEVVESNQRSLAADRTLLAAWGNRELPMGVASSSLSATNHATEKKDAYGCCYVEMLERTSPRLQRYASCRALLSWFGFPQLLQ